MSQSFDMPPRTPTKAITLRALFIGNSFTQRNDVPGMIATLASHRGHTFEHKLISRGGASLRAHWNKGEAQRELASTKLDVVVLQEQSTLPVKNTVRMQENVRLFDAAIREAGARTVLYMTWARKHEPHNQRVIADAYTSIGSELGAVVAPAGLAWERYLADNGTLQLHDKDMSHPTLAGSYLAACVLYATLFEDSPAGIDSPIKGLDAADAERLREIAGQAG